jgi:hypothetical protein
MCTELPPLPVLTPKQKMDCLNFWRDRYELLEGRISKEAQTALSWFLNVDAFGYGTGEISDGHLGQCDMFFFMWQEMSFPKDIAGLITGLSVVQVEQLLNDVGDSQF